MARVQGPLATKIRDSLPPHAATSRKNAKLRVAESRTAIGVPNYTRARAVEPSISPTGSGSRHLRWWECCSPGSREVFEVQCQVHRVEVEGE